MIFDFGPARYSSPERITKEATKPEPGHRFDLLRKIELALSFPFQEKIKKARS